MTALDALLPCRVAFEKWFYAVSGQRPIRGKDGEYKYALDRNFWYAWQGAWNTRALTRHTELEKAAEGLVGALKPITDIIEDNVNGWQKNPLDNRHPNELGYTIKITCGKAYKIFDALSTYRKAVG